MDISQFYQFLSNSIFSLLMAAAPAALLLSVVSRIVSFIMNIISGNEKIKL